MIAADADLLVIGGLTIDRLADGSSAPGGSVLHIARALTRRGFRVSIITVGGPEPEARAGLDELRQLAVALESETATATATFVHREVAAGRQLGFVRAGGEVRITGTQLPATAQGVLLAPIAGEVTTRELGLLESAPAHAAALQGWLRRLEVGVEVRPLPLDAMDPAALDALSRFDLVAASREDLLAESTDPREQLAALRRVVGPRPDLVVTDGAAGAWHDAAGADGTRHLPVPLIVDGVSTVGAGDVLAALLTVGLPGATEGLEARLRAAMRTVAEVLEQRPPS